MTIQAVSIQKFPFPQQLADLVKACRYRDWKVWLEHRDRGQGSEGLTLIIQTVGKDSYHPDRPANYRVNHFMPVPPAAYDMRSWRRWLFNQFLLVEQHECMEFFIIGERRPFAPHHGFGQDPYNIFDHGTSEDVRTQYTGKVLKEKPIPSPMPDATRGYGDPINETGGALKCIHPNCTCMNAGGSICPIGYFDKD